MATKKRVHVAAILFTFFALVISQSARFKKSNGFYDCYVQQACSCGMFSRLDDCWNELSEEARRSVIDEYNKCDIGDKTFGYTSMDTMKEFSNVFCSIPDDIRRPCYYQVNEKYKERVKKTAMGLLGRDEAFALEKARKCGEPVLAFCINNPTGCISEG